MDLARSMMEEELAPAVATTADAPAANRGVDDLAHIIDAVLSRMTVTLHDTTVRLEYGSGRTAHALEITIDR